ncbi:protease inhibitor [Saccharopolyspora indica]|uniref:SSI family serine proteinase inhibitor n=1 Tax=Saccharopolyspora indica TaxID=1229659 RepID=UPI0022EA45C5|nr:SSI family serine proteinase inhibitor [Saccharopolyspora indica]MDA3647181.1 SSI family serine proteinase inhibitor [Saccharopolyspora indica]
MTAIQFIGRSFAVAALLLGAVLVPTSANAEGAETRLNLTVQDLHGQTAPETATLTCEPAGGSHPAASDACAILVQAAGNIADVPTQSPNATCPLIWRPVAVTTTGLWNGTPIDYSKTFPNDCVLRSELGAIFDF